LADVAVQVAVVGSGLMGAEISLVFAMAGHEVVMIDHDRNALERAMLRIKRVLTTGVGRGFYTEEAVASSMDRIIPSQSYEDLRSVDMVTEAVYEAQSVKESVLASLASVCKPTCVLATNTSTIPISTLAATLPAARRPYFLGTHYFSPVSRMKLVEVITGFDTGPQTTDWVCKTCEAIGKVAIRVKDVAGFAVNRMLHAFIIEAVRLADEGVASLADIDQACRLGLGHPLGPFELMDIVGSNLCVQAQEIMQEAYGERFRPPALLKQRVRAGYVGGKGRPGWRSSARS
jgi:3-hydroxybutyryl-CoA dehydrogenase